MKTAAIYARVSSEEENTIASQTSALIAFAREQNCDVPAEWVIEDDGYRCHRARHHWPWRWHTRCKFTVAVSTASELMVRCSRLICFWHETVMAVLSPQ